MARRERERYTERVRPNRQASRGSGGGGGGDGSEQAVDSTALVYAAAGALVVAVALLLGMFVMRSRNPTAGAGTPPAATAAATTAASSAVTDTQSAAPTTAAAAPAAPAGGKKTYAKPEDQKLDPANKAYFATIETGRGQIVVQLFPDVAPQHVNSFVFLARQGFYDGLTFHRVEPNFVIQGGDPAGNGSGGPGYSIPAEFAASNPIPHRVGTLAMARSSDPNSAGSQFYIVTADGPSASSLNGQYTVFGHVIKGLKVVKETAVGDIMTKVTIEEKPKSASVVTPDDIRKGKLPAND